MSPLPAPDHPDAPKYWRYETSGDLARAVERFLNNEPMTPVDIGLMRLYLMQWVDSPVWDMKSFARRRDALRPRPPAQNRETDHLGAPHSQLDPPRAPYRHRPVMKQNFYLINALLRRPGVTPLGAYCLGVFTVMAERAQVTAPDWPLEQALLCPDTDSAYRVIDDYLLVSLCRTDRR
jgi:hypothetical protein